MGIKILYAGDSPVGGAANYLLGILHSMKVSVVHLAPAIKLTPSDLKTKFDVIIFSDYSKSQVSAECQKRVAAQVEAGTGFLMIGGWGSYSGPFGGWQGSKIESVMPVFCKKTDDRTNFPGGAALIFKDSGAFLDAKTFAPAPAICGLNEIVPKRDSRTLLSVRRILTHKDSVALESREYPLLVIGTHGLGRTASLATDLAPHWCGGLVDWGSKTLRLSVTSKIHIQVGNYYVGFVSALLSWLARA